MSVKCHDCVLQDALIGTQADAGFVSTRKYSIQKPSIPLCIHLDVSMDAPGKNRREYVCICYADVCERVCVVSECERVNEVDLHVYIQFRARFTSMYPDGV